MVEGLQNDELIREAAVRHSVDPDVISRLLVIAPNFENLNIYGVKAEFTRSVERILDEACATKENGGKG